MSGAVEVAGQRAVGARPAANPRTRPWPSPWEVAAGIFMLYGLILAAMSFRGYDARDSIVLGKNYVQKSHASSAIRVDPHYHYVPGGSGYDGQFFYYIAVDPVNARYYMDDPVYRYSKILYPATARALALGQPQLVPYTMVLVNWLAIAAGTLLLAMWLQRKGASPALAMVYAICPGLFAAFQRDLTEPLSYALVIAAVYLFDFGGRYRYLWSALAFALAVLARDKSAIFAALYTLGLLFRAVDVRRPAAATERLLLNTVPASAFGAASVAPYIAWRLFLRHWLHTGGSVTGVHTSYEAAPLAGALFHGLSTGTKVMYLFVLLIPAAICAAMGIWAFLRRVWGVPLFLLLLLIELSVVSLNPDYFIDVYGVLRVSVGVILAATLCIPLFDRVTGGNRLWFHASAAGWLCLSTAYLLLFPAWFLGGRA